MKKIINVFFLLMLPVAFIFLSFVFKNSAGELYLSNNYDPSYVYLFNSLNLAQLKGYGVGHIDHPGTPVQTAGALIIYFLNFNSVNNIVTGVFENPEFYLSKINLFFILLNSAALFVLGLTAYRRLSGIYNAIFIQLTPFASVTVFSTIMNVSPEPFLVFVILCLLILTIRFTTEKKILSRSLLVVYAAAFGIICGLGLSAKISFFPILILPLFLIKGISNKILYCIFCTAAFFIFVIPAISHEHSYKFINWIRKLITHSGKYGGGGKNFFETGGIINNLKIILTNEPVFVFSYILIIISAVIFFIKSKNQSLKLSVNYRLLLAILTVITIQIIVVLKHFELHYLIPAYLLVIPGLYAAYAVMHESFPEMNAKRKQIYIIFFLSVFIVLQINVFTGNLSYLNHRRLESENAFRFMEKNYKDEVKVSSYGASSKQFALHIGASYGGSKKNNYYSLLKNMFPQDYFFDKWSGNIFPMSNQDGQDKLVTSKKIILQCDGDDAKNEFAKVYKKISSNENVVSEKVFENSFGESVFEIEVK